MKPIMRFKKMMAHATSIIHKILNLISRSESKYLSYNYLKLKIQPVSSFSVSLISNNLNEDL